MRRNVYPRFAVAGIVDCVRLGFDEQVRMLPLTAVAKRHNISRASVCRLMKETNGDALPVRVGFAEVGTTICQ